MPSNREPETAPARPRRAGRPPQLTTATVVDAAIELADDRGLNDLSMPQLARHLGVGTMTLYSYVENKQDLLDRMKNRIFDGVALTGDGDGDWQTELLTYFTDYREAALAHPTIAGLLAGGRAAIPAVFDTLEAVFAKMASDGMPVEDAVRTFYAALTYTIGHVLWEIPRARLQPEAAYEQEWTDLISELDPTAYPILTGPAKAITPTVASTEQFTWGLKRLIGAA